MTDPIVRCGRRRTAVAGAGVLLALAAAVVTAPAAGDPDWSVIAVLMVATGGTVLVGVVALGRPGRRDHAAAAWMLAPLLVWLPDGRLPLAMPQPAAAVLTIVAAGLCYLVGHLLAGPDVPRPTRERPPPDAVRLPLADGERVLWSRSISSRPAMLLALLCAAGATLQFAIAATGSPSNLVAGGVLTVGAVLAVFRCWARIRVGAHGVRVEQPLLRRALAEAPIGEVRAARAGPVSPQLFRPLQYGVLYGEEISGYRATRGGDALTLDLTGDRRFVVTVPDAGTAAGLVNAELDRQRGPRGPAC